MSLFIELFHYSIPSVVSTKQLLYPNSSSTDYFSDHVKKFFNWSLQKKIVVFVIPMLFIYVLHGLPLYVLYKMIFSDMVLTHAHFVVYIGIFLVIIGRIISHFYLNSIKKIKAKTYDSFIISGLYKFSRNPGLLGLYTSFFGFLLIEPSPLFIICFIIYIIHMHYKIIMEEDYLTNKHGEAYKDYLNETRRYI